MITCDDDLLQKKLDAAMPWVGLYIAAASAVCTLAMTADAFNGFRRKKLWFPCKYFSLNATSLTLLAAAMKLPMDLNSIMICSEADWLAKFSSLVFMSTALANFMSSLGSMNDKDILANVVALGILVITIVANVWIQLIEIHIILFGVPTTLMLLLLATLVSLAITVPTTKRRLESKYQEQHKVALREEEVLKRREAFTIDNQRGYMMKYLVMAETSSPQFVMARSVVSTTSAVICLLNAIILAGIYIRIFLGHHRESIFPPESVYGMSTIWIQVIQSIGIVVGSIAPTLRCWPADVCWIGVVLYMKWLDIDLRRTSLKCKNSKVVLQELSNKAEGIIMEFRKEVKDPIMENPLNWPTKFVAANSMYRISRTILLSCEEENEHTDEGMFERLSVMIADILAACSTNLARVITTMCHRNAIEKRGKSVRKAFLLLGETERVLELLQQQEWPSLDHDKAAYIEEWRALFQQDKDDPAASVSSEEHLAITLDC